MCIWLGTYGENAEASFQSFTEDFLLLPQPPLAQRRCWLKLLLTLLLSRSVTRSGANVQSYCTGQCSMYCMFECLDYFTFRQWNRVIATKGFYTHLPVTQLIHIMLENRKFKQKIEVHGTWNEQSCETNQLPPAKILSVVLVFDIICQLEKAQTNNELS